MNDNELIAGFMGLRYNRKDIEWYDPEGDGMGANLHYKTSWDWLMPVVEKIQDIEIKNKRVSRTAAEVTIFYKACMIEYFPDEDSGDEHEEFKCSTQGKTKLEAVYKAVVEFIKWHNQQKQ